jgi:hypothetical protein
MTASDGAFVEAIIGILGDYLIALQLGGLSGGTIGTHRLASALSSNTMNSPGSR